MVCVSFLYRFIDIDYVLQLINTITTRALFVFMGYFVKELFVIKGFGLQHTSENTKSSARFYEKNGRLNVYDERNHSPTTPHPHKLSSSTATNFQFTKPCSKRHQFFCKSGSSFKSFFNFGPSLTRRSQLAFTHIDSLDHEPYFNGYERCKRGR